MPRVVEDQRAKFHSDVILRQLQEDSEVRYVDHIDCSLDERRLRFRTDCHEGSCKIGFVCNGVHLLLCLPKAPGSHYTSPEFVDFTSATGKVYIQCPLIFNGVCVKFFGCMDLHMLSGTGHLEFDEGQAQAEHHVMVETLRMKSLAPSTSSTS